MQNSVPLLSNPQWRRGVWLLALVSVATLTAGIGLRDPWPADEPRFALIARDLVHHGDWLFPRRNGELYAEKPPLFMWMIALCYQATGSLRLAFLLPSLIAGLATLALVTDLARRLWNPRVGLLAGWTLLASGMFCWQSRAAQIDAVLVGWTTLGVYGLCRHLLLGPAWGWLAIAALAMGAGVISKGVGFLPLFLFIPWAFALWRHWRPLPRPGWNVRWWLLLLIAVPILAWLIPMIVAASRSPDLAAYSDNLLHRQTHERYANAWHHREPWWYYLTQLPALWAPLTLLLPWAIPAWWRRLRRGDPRTGLLLGTIVIIIAFFSLSPGKRGVYLYPTVPVLVLALAPLLPGLLRQRLVRRLGMGIGIGIAAIAMLAAPPVQALLLSSLPTDAQERIAAENLDLSALGWIAFGIGLSSFLWLGWKARRHPWTAWMGLWCSAWIILCWAGWPVLNRSRFPSGFMDRAQTLAGPNAEFAMTQYREQYVLAAPHGLTTFGYGRMDRDQEIREAISWMQAEPNRFLLLQNRTFEQRYVDPGRSSPLGTAHDDEWLLVPADAVREVPLPPSKPRQDR